MCRTRKPPARTQKRLPQDLSCLAYACGISHHLVHSCWAATHCMQHFATLVRVPEWVLDLLQMKQGILVRGPCRSVKNKLSPTNCCKETGSICGWSNNDTIAKRNPPKTYEGKPWTVNKCLEQWTAGMHFADSPYLPVAGGNNGGSKLLFWDLGLCLVLRLLLLKAPQAQRWVRDGKNWNLEVGRPCQVTPKPPVMSKNSHTAKLNHLVSA